MSCKPDEIRKRIDSNVIAEVRESLLDSNGVRLVLRRDVALRELPREVLEKLVDCNVVELVYPDNRVVYIRGDVLRRVIGNALHSEKR